ncbi:glycoside hydrolase family 30 beta sandwich domain-containing protein [Paenibacillus sediminis]|uniref:Glucosylceramidase n=1 Tax=Paenibacillus sediminis TaxID=664909 RepID=A0ABS4H101_9BACL|nr:glycoside hydrolase family 30 beta sandwich domain-containing protein [Paenibacillus sediminis]MBP1936199.1 glucosylceramidase [Paenibacillus sediminis]
MSNLTIYESNGEHSLFVKKTKDQLAKADAQAKVHTIIIDDSVQYQEMDGFGASFTDSAAYLIHQVLSPEQRVELMSKLFNAEEGIGLSVIRNPMGASDYARDFYSYNDLPEGETDPLLQKFSISHDEEDIIPLLKEAVKLNPHLKLMGSPWSPPGWMKTSGSMIGGELIKEYYPVYADYFVRYIEAYAQHELPVYAITPQNEALYSPGHYPGMIFPAKDQSRFIKDHLKPKFDKHGIETKILCYDHNWDMSEYPLTVLEQAQDAVDGVAWHWYGGHPSAQSEVFKAFPDKEVHFTEGSGGEWIPPFEQAFSNVMRTGIEILRNYSKSFVLWNMALDEKNGPTVPGFGNSTCRGVVTVNQETRELTYTLDYYALAHFSKHIRPKAVRIGSNSDEAVRSVAFKNTDGSLAVVLFNDSREAKGVEVKLPSSEAVSFSMEAKSAITLALYLAVEE